MIGVGDWTDYGWDHGYDDPGVAEVCAAQAYEEAGIGPKDVSVIECHDASAPAELMAYESLQLCGKGEGRDVRGTPFPGSVWWSIWPPPTSARSDPRWTCPLRCPC